MGTLHSRQPNQPRGKNGGSSTDRNNRGTSISNNVTMSPGPSTSNNVTMSPGTNTSNNVTMSPDTSISNNITMSPGTTTLDTVTMARREREMNGPWDVEVTYGGDVDLQQHFKDCERNPGHLNFVPVFQFNVDHLPFNYHDKALVDLVRAISDVTVRVSVKYVSDRRPKTFPGSDKPYPCYRTSGRDMLRVGTGWVGQVEKFPDKSTSDKVYCPCCQNSGNPKTEFALIYIATAAHLVYDEFEAAHTTCHLFYDRGDTPNNCLGVETLSGAMKVSTHIEKDCCFLTFVTHDMYLADMLDEMAKRCTSLFEKVHQNYLLFMQDINARRQPNANCDSKIDRQQDTVTDRQQETEAGKQQDTETDKQSGTKIDRQPELVRSDGAPNTETKKITDKEKLEALKQFAPHLWHTITIIVSHPHGCSKQVSVGYSTMKEIWGRPDYSGYYTTDTCPGSSGALVFILGYKSILMYSHPHTGYLEENKGLNYSALKLYLNANVRRLDGGAVFINLKFGREAYTKPA